MTTLYRTDRRVKPARPFGAGLLTFAPIVRVDHSADDRAWAAYHLNNGPTADDRRFDRMAEDARQMASYEAGYVGC